MSWNHVGDDRPTGPPYFLDRLVGELHPESAGNASWFHLREPLRFWDGYHVWTVPAGFQCDLASIPWWARWIANWEAWRPGVLHDYLVREVPQVSRLEADALFAIALGSENLPFWRQVLMYGAVRTHAAWRWTVARKP